MPNLVSYLPIWHMIMPALGAPVSSNPSNPSSERPWGAEPKGRGSLGILTNCLLTLGLCVWTTIHVDFDPHTTFRQAAGRKMFLVILAMLAPELVMAVAGGQWLDARKLRDAWCSINGNVTPGGEKDTFGMAGAYLVRMGGVAVCPPSWFPNIYATVSEEKFVELMENSPEIISKVDKTFAKNKGKTDALGKAIVCAQGMWMIIQCITRKASGLPVTLLELRVAMHVICAVVMYLLWWDKPQDIKNHWHFLRILWKPA